MRHRPVLVVQRRKSVCEIGEIRPVILESVFSSSCFSLLLVFSQLSKSMNRKMICFWILPLFTLVAGVRWTEFPVGSTSGHKNLHSLSSSSFVSFLQSSNLSVVWFHPKTINASDKQYFVLLRDSFLTPVSDRLQIPVAEFPLTNESTAITKTLGINATEIDTIHVYSRLRRIVYYGIRTPDALTSFIKKLRCPSFTVIAGKLEKKMFDMVDKTRALSFVVPGSAAAGIYANASRAFPYVPFYVVTDDLVARSLRLDEGNVYFYRAGSHGAAELKAPSSSAQIESFIRSEASKPFFHVKKMTSENIHAPWIERSDQPKFVLLVTSSNAPRSSHFQKLLRRAVKNDTECEVHVIDVDLFPGMADYWRDNFKIDLNGKSALGYVAFDNSSGIWLTERQLNGTGGKDADRQNEKVIADFIGLILNGTVNFSHGVEIERETGIPVFQTEAWASKEGNLDVGTPVDLLKLKADIQQDQNKEDGVLHHDTVVQPNGEQDSRHAYFVAHSRNRAEDAPTWNTATPTSEPQDAIHKFEHDLTTFGDAGNSYKRDRLEF